MLSELGKYGASFVLVTQSLAKLDAIGEALRPTLFSNVDGLTVAPLTPGNGGLACGGGGGVTRVRAYLVTF